MRPLAMLFAICWTLPLAQAQQPTPSIDPTVRVEVIERVIDLLNRNYVFPDVAKRMEQSLRRRLDEKEYDGITNGEEFARTLTAQLQQVNKDRHLRVSYSEQPLPERAQPGAPPTPEERQRAQHSQALNNFGFVKAERLAGNIGYLELRMFSGDELAKESAAAAMTFLANTSALIIDLRRNGGGTSAMIQFLCGYLFEAPVHLNTFYLRSLDRTTESWSEPSVPGKRYLGKEIYLLTSKRTFSAAEEFAYDLKHLRRASLVGETTGGGAHIARRWRVTEHFELMLPVGRAINPITKTNWEGVGVKPDIEVAADLALMTAHLAAMKNLLAAAREPDLRKELEQAIAELQKSSGSP